MKFAERLADGNFEWRFASQPQFPYWALSIRNNGISCCHRRMFTYVNILLMQTYDKGRIEPDGQFHECKPNGEYRICCNAMCPKYESVLIEQKGCPAFYLHLVQLTAIGQIYKACYRMRKVHSPPDWSFI